MGIEEMTTPEDITALEQSISKWEANVRAEDPTKLLFGADNCPLCAIYYNFDEKANTLDCSGCPVSKKTGANWCDGSPYIEAYHAGLKWKLAVRRGEMVKPFEAAARAAMQAEVDFLKHVLEETNETLTSGCLVGGNDGLSGSAHMPHAACCNCR
jgi:hypothetical protein